MNWYVALIIDGCRSIIEFDNRENMLDAITVFKSENREILCVWSEVIKC